MKRLALLVLVGLAAMSGVAQARIHPALNVSAAHRAASRYALYHWVRQGYASGYHIVNCDRHSRSAAACEVVFYGTSDVPDNGVGGEDDLILSIGRHWDRSITVSSLFDAVTMR